MKKFIKRFLLAIVLIPAACLAIVLVIGFFGAIVSGNEDNTATSTEQATEPEQVTNSTATTLDELWEEMLAAVEGKEVGTSERSDAIAFFAKDAAKSQNEDIGNEAVEFIWENFPNYYDTNELMEKILLCGYYLEYMDYTESVTKLGQDAAQAVKYVYRGAEGIEDTGTVENLRQIEENIVENFLKD